MKQAAKHTHNSTSPISHLPLPPPNKPRSISSIIGVLIAFLFLIIINEPFITATTTASFTYIDEITASLIVFIFVLHLLISSHTHSNSEIIILSWILYCIIISIFFGINGSTFDIIAQSIIQSKLFLFSVFLVIFLKDRSSQFFLRTALYLIISGGIVSIVFSNIFLTLSSERYIGDFWITATPLGFQLNPNRFGRLLALIPLISHLSIGVSKRTYFVLIVMCFFLIVLSGSRSALAFFLFSLSLQFMSVMWSKKSRIWISLIFGPIICIAILLMAADALRLERIELVELTGDYAPAFRIILLIDGLTLARDYFPIGAGLATFGTPFSLDQPTYQYLLTGKTFFFQRGNVFDNNYASILGETGLLGICFVMVLIYMTLWRVLRVTSYYIRYGFLFYLLSMLFFESTLQSGSAAAFIALALRGAVADANLRDVKVLANEVRRKGALTSQS